MGILDDLKNQSDALQAQEKSEEERQKELLEYYQENIHPRMLELYNFLTEFIKHLNFIKHEVKVDYPVMPGSQPLPLTQYDYKVTIDSTKEVRNINLVFACHLDEELEIELEGKEAPERYEEILKSYRIKFERKDNKDRDFELLGATFKVIGPIVVNVVFQGDVDTSSIFISFNNFDKPGIHKLTYKDRHITEEFLDELGKYILRQNPEFMKLDIDESVKDKLREQIQAEMRQRQAELEEAERREEEELRKQEEKKSWKNVFKKTTSEEAAEETIGDKSSEKKSWKDLFKKD